MKLVGIAMTSNQDRGLDMVATGRETGAGTVCHMSTRKTLSGIMTWPGWTPIGDRRDWVLAHAGPAMARNADRRLEAVVVGTDLAVWHAWQDHSQSDWSEWRSLGRPGGKDVTSQPHGTMPSDPTPVLVVNADRRLEVFVVRDDLTVWRRSQPRPNAGPWVDWSSLGRPGDGTPGPLAAATNRNGRLELFATDLRGTVWHCWQTSPNGQWSKWSSLGQPGGSPVRAGKPALAENQDGSLELFVVADTGTVWHRWQTQKDWWPWSDWTALSRQGSGFAELAVAADARGQLVLFATEPQNGSDLWQRRRQTSPSGGWSAWLSRAELLSPSSGSAWPVVGPTLCLDGENQLVLCLQVSNPAQSGNGGMYWIQESARGDWTGGDPLDLWTA